MIQAASQYEAVFFDDMIYVLYPKTKKVLTGDRSFSTMKETSGHLFCYMGYYDFLYNKNPPGGLRGRGVAVRLRTLFIQEVFMAKDTKQRILDAALEMFSEKGYDGTNIRELTASLGLVKSSMYKHFKSKEDIWNTLLDDLISYYDERFGSADRLPPVPDSLEEFAAMTMRMVDFTVHDEKVIKTRKLLTIEQFRDDRARKLATKHFLTGLEEMFTNIFAGMMEKGLIRQDDPAMLAFAYTTPISALIHLCDREPEKTEEAIRQIEAFSRHFIKTYGSNHG